MRIASMPKSELVGTYVYAPYSPLNIGKVTEVTERKRGENIYSRSLVVVQWMKPQRSGKQTTVEDPLHLNNFQDLIDDHEKKLRNHRERLKKAKVIIK